MSTNDVTSQVVLLGNPFNKNTFAKNVWDMQVYNDRVYLGHGDYISNAGPIPVIYFDIKTNKFVSQFTVDEEQINNYKVLNGKLYIPGTDAREDWSFGNFYAMDDDRWTKFRTIPNANHVWDMAYYNGQLYAAIGVTTKDACGLLVSKDMGKTWATVLSAFSTINDWITTIFQINNKLYSTGQLLFPPPEAAGYFTKYRNVLVMDGSNPAIQPYDNRFFPGASIYYTYDMIRATTFNNTLVFLGAATGQAQWSPDSMFAATSLTQVRRITFPTFALPTDIIVCTCCNIIYVLTYIKNSANSYTNIVYKSEDLQNWTELFRFNTDTFARSFEKIYGDFYFGLGCSIDVLPASTGNILKVSKSAYQAIS